MDNLHVLVEAKKEYTEQLNNVMCPLMIEVFQEIYKNSCTLSKGKKTLMYFQKLLQEVKLWNSTIITQHADDIMKRCTWFNDLLTAVFVSHVKILSSVRLKSESKKISIRLPTASDFLHTCYIKAAGDLYKDPYIYHEEYNEYERDELLCKRFKECIDSTIKELVPIQEILKTYVSPSDIEDDGGIMAGGPLPDIEEPAIQEPEPESDHEETEDEEKKIVTTQEDDVLFGDAPDEKKKTPL